MSCDFQCSVSLRHGAMGLVALQSVVVVSPGHSYFYFFLRGRLT